MILYLGLIFPSNSATANGKTYNFWDVGHMVYFLCIFVVSSVLLKRTNNHTLFGTILLALSATSFFWVLKLESRFMKTSDVYDIWDEWLSSPTAWFGSIVVISSVWTIDPILKMTYETICSFCCRRG